MLNRPLSVMEDAKGDSNVTTSKYDPFVYMVSVILIWKMRTQRKLVYKSGLWFEDSKLKSKLIYSTLFNVQRNWFDEFIDDGYFQVE